MAARPKVLMTHVDDGEGTYVGFAPLDAEAREVLEWAVESTVEIGPGVCGRWRILGPEGHARDGRRGGLRLHGTAAKRRRGVLAVW